MIEITLTYRIRVREWRPYASKAAWMTGNPLTHPLIVLREVGTRRTGWPWARRTVPTHEVIGAAYTHESAGAIIAEDAKNQMQTLRRLFVRKQLTTSAEREVSVVITLGPTPADDTFTVNNKAVQTNA